MHKQTDGQTGARYYWQGMRDGGAGATPGRQTDRRTDEQKLLSSQFVVNPFNLSD